MPVNATPEYEKAEARYRQATSPAEQLEGLEEMLRLIPKHKGSEKVQAELKRKISALRKKQASGGGRGGTTQVDPYYVPRGGAGQIALVGLPNTGKSAIIAAVTEAPVKVADYPFATTIVTPGMWLWNDVQLQLLDTPPVTAEHFEGGMVNLIRRSDVVLVVTDAASPESLDQVEIVRTILAERKTGLFECPTAEIPQEALWGKPPLVVATHADVVGPDDIDTLAELLGGPLKVVGVDCVSGVGVEELAREIWRLLHVIRVYTKRPHQKADMKDPFTLPIGSTIEDLAYAIHRDLPEHLKFARIWGEGRHDGQQVHRTETLRDRDVVEIHE